MGMYHKNRYVGVSFKRYAKRRTSKGMRRAAKKSCCQQNEEKITIIEKSKNIHGIDSWEFS